MDRILIIAIAAFSFLLTGTHWQQSEVDDIPQSITSFERVEGQINWLTWEQAMDSIKITKKKILVDIYTDWCGWCKEMDKTTFSKKEIVDYVNKNYYAVKFNAEQRESIQLNEKEYKYVSNSQSKGRGYHQLALHLTKGRLTYPTFVFLNDDTSIIQPIPGYKKAEIFEIIMIYFGDDYHKKIPWNVFQENYKEIKQEKTFIKE